MANYTVDPVTGILIPTVGVDPGPDYATNVSNALATLAHLTHTGVSNLDGYQIPAAGLNINADVSIQSHNLTSLRSTRYTNQNATLAGSGDLDCVYFKSGDLWINNGSGTPVQITGGVSVNVTASNNYSTKFLTTNYTINSSDGYILFSCNTGAAIILTLPLANSVPAGRFYLVKDRTGTAHTNNVTINPAGSDTIDALSTLKLIANLGAVALVSDGTSNWQVLQYDKTIYKGTDTLSFETGATLSMDSTSPANLSGVVSFKGRTAMDGYVVTTGTTYTIPTANSNLIFLCIPSGAAITINLPPAPSAPAGTMIIVKDAWGTANAHNITINPNGTDNIEGLNAPKIIQANWGSVTLVSATNFANNYWVML